MIEDFIKELERNQKINRKRGYENKVDIDYVIERLKDIKLDIELTEQYIDLYKDLCHRQANKINELRGSDNNG